MLTRTWLIPGTAAERELKLTDRDMAALRVFSVSLTLQKLGEAVLEIREVSELPDCCSFYPLEKLGLA